MDLINLVGPIILFVLMLVVGLELTVADFRRVLAAPRAIIGGTLGQWILLPIMTLGVVTFFDLKPAFAAGAVLVAVSPGAGASNVATALGRGNVALSVSLTATACVFAVFTLPVISALTLSRFVENAEPVGIPVEELIFQLFLTLLVPIGLGMWIRSRLGERAEHFAPRLQRLGFLLIGVFLVVGIAFAPEEAKPDLRGTEMALLAAGVWTVLAAGLGWLTATALRLPPDDRFAFVIEFAARNIAVSTIVAMSGLGRVDFALFGIVYTSIGYPIVTIIVVARRRLLARSARNAGELDSES